MIKKLEHRPSEINEPRVGEETMPVKLYDKTANPNFQHLLSFFIYFYVAAVAVAVGLSFLVVFVWSVMNINTWIGLTIYLLFQFTNSIINEIQIQFKSLFLQRHIHCFVKQILNLILILST